MRNTYKARPCLAQLIRGIRAMAKGVVADRPMDRDIERMVQAITESDQFTGSEPDALPQGGVP
jgi:hypothetical protein